MLTIQEGLRACSLSKGGGVAALKHCGTHYMYADICVIEGHNSTQ